MKLSYDIATHDSIFFQNENGDNKSFGGYEEERFENKVYITKLNCSVCLKVLKDPVQCPNEHCFCRSCIQRCLRDNKTCPMCKHPLTEETLTKLPRIVKEMWENLMIRCDYENRGCQELIKLEFLDRHVSSCGYSPTRCTNAGCAEVINQHEKERHERELCQFRKIVCQDCGEQVIWKSRRLHPCFMQKQIDDLARRLNVVQTDVGEIKHEVKLTKEEMKLTKEEMKLTKEEVKLTKEEVKLTREEMTYLTREATENAREATERCDLFTGRQKIFVCGGHDGKTLLNSAESYSWPDNSWTLEPTMNEKRSNHSTFVHDREIYVGGGWTETKLTDSIEILNVDEENLEWKPQSPQFKMPIKGHGHKMVYHENRVIHTGGSSEGGHVSDGIYEISLNPPHNTKLLAKMPEPRSKHGCEIIDNQVVVAGGLPTKFMKATKNTVYAYDLNNGEPVVKALPPLPSPVYGMATVSYKGNVILIGGVDDCKTLNTVMIYDVKTGKIKMLPCLNHERAGCAAVITGNVIVAMGGYVHETNNRLNSVEFLDLSTNVWRELSPMTTKRAGLTAVLKPIV